MTLDAEQLLTGAELATGLSDWGGDQYFEASFRTLFDAMVTSIETDANLHDRGRRGAALRLQEMAESRLRFIDDRTRWPDIGDAPVRAPIFIVGLPRSGSSFLLDLMSQDPANRTTRTWEMLFPSPPPEPATYGSDPRIERCQTLLDAMGLSEPTVTSLHPFGSEQPEESTLMMELMALGDNPSGVWRLSRYNEVRIGIDMREGYEIQRMVLQNLQYRYHGERWILKSPGHIFNLSELLSVYPDAGVIQTHRDPAKVIPSVAALLTNMRRANSDAPVRTASVARGNLQAFAHGLERAMQFREDPAMDAHFHDVHFRALIADPMRTVSEIYRRFERPLSDHASDRMERWLASDASHTAKAKFTLDDFELTEEQIDAAFGAYIAHHAIELERCLTPNCRDV